MKLHTSLLSLLSLVALPLASFAGQPTTGTTSAPAPGGTAIPGGSQTASYVISKSGAYYLSSDRVMTADVAGIIVNVPDVTIDLNGSTLRFSNPGAANGIEIPAVSNIEIRNGSINDVPADAIHAISGSGLRVIDVRVTTAGKSGVYSTAAMTTVDRSDFSYCGQWGVYVFANELVRITNTNASHNGLDGITVAAANGSEVSNCRARKNQRSGISTNSSGTLILNNVASQNNLGKTAGEGGIVLGLNCTARGNLLSFNYLNGIYVNYGGSIIEGNSIASTVNAAANSYNGNAINVGSGTVLSASNRITPSISLQVGSIVDGGGNVIF